MCESYEKINQLCPRMVYQIYGFCRRSNMPHVIESIIFTKKVL